MRETSSGALVGGVTLDTACVCGFTCTYLPWLIWLPTKLVVGPGRSTSSYPGGGLGRWGLRLLPLRSLPLRAATILCGPPCTSLVQTCNRLMCKTIGRQ